MSRSLPDSAAWLAPRSPQPLHVSFVSWASDTADPPGDVKLDVFLTHLDTLQVELVSVARAGAQRRLPRPVDVRGRALRRLHEHGQQPQIPAALPGNPPPGPGEPGAPGADGRDGTREPAGPATRR